MHHATLKACERIAATMAADSFCGAYFVRECIGGVLVRGTTVDREGVHHEQWRLSLRRDDTGHWRVLGDPAMRLHRTPQAALRDYHAREHGAAD